jgi:ethylmalonyl-CoA mutase
LVPEVIQGLKAEGLGAVPVIVGGIIPEDDAAALRNAGVARVYTPKDFEMVKILSDMVDVAEAAQA